MRCIPILLLAGVLSACGGEDDSPEARVRALVAAAERAAEGREFVALAGMVAESYSDADGHDRRAVTDLARAVLLRHMSIHLLVRVREAAVAADGRATAAVLVAMAGQPLPEDGDLAGLRADLYRFDLEFIEEQGEWRVSGARWRRAGVEEFL